jgi:hypothetical protein
MKKNHNNRQKRERERVRKGPIAISNIAPNITHACTSRYKKRDRFIPASIQGLKNNNNNNNKNKNKNKNTHTHTHTHTHTQTHTQMRT